MNTSIKLQTKLDDRYRLLNNVLSENWEGLDDYDGMNLRQIKKALNDKWPDYSDNNWLAGQIKRVVGR